MIDTWRENTIKGLRGLIMILSLVLAIFQIYIACSTAISVIQQRVFHVFMLIFLYGLYQLINRIENNKISSFYFALLVIIAAAAGVYFIRATFMGPIMRRSVTGPSFIDIVWGVVLTLMILDIARRTVGVSLTIIAAVFYLYALFGPYMPDIIAHRGYKIPYITNYLAWTMEGIFGTAIGASVSFVALYIIFGELLEKFGAGQFFIDVAYALTGRMRGGPAEAAVVSSALMGSINGSAVANVVTTGTFTIPLMKKVGFPPYFAGAVEAVASTGGQLLPPVMGAAAFVMADTTGIPYSQIVIAAVIPGILYYLALGISVYLEAGKRGINAEESAKLPQFFKVVKGGWYYILPIAALIVALLGFGFSANYSAIFAIAVLLMVGIIKDLLEGKKFPLKKIADAFIGAMKGVIPVAMACACAGIVIGIVSMTGIGVKFTSIVFRLSGGHLFIMLFLIMIACIIMGMGLPSTAAYIIAATVGVPSLINAGIEPLAANMFVFYFAIISFITPPVALAAYAASGIADSNASKTGIQAFILGLSGFIIPYIYAYNPAMLIIGAAPADIVYITLVSIFAIFMLTVVLSGWLKEPVPLIFRLLLSASIIMIFIQVGRLIDYIGIALGLFTMAILVLRIRKKVLS
jgi:TRAP transporter 4TM/12TM fusion protein